MILKQIYIPIADELSKVDNEIRSQINSMSSEQEFLNSVINYFFDTPGKYLRPALVLLSAKAANYIDSKIAYQLIQLATSVELIHSASLIHDDIIDLSEFRRQQRTLNEKFGNQIAVIAGDLIYSKTFAILLEKLDKKILTVLFGCVGKMCRGEINEMQKPYSSFDSYLSVIKDKTASFMAACCQTGVMLTNAGDKKIEILKSFGENFGIAYQLNDDFIDKDFEHNFKIDMIYSIKEYTEKAKNNILLMENSIYKESLKGLCTYLYEESIKHEDKLEPV